MRYVLFVFTLLSSLPALAQAQDDSPYFGSEGSGVIQFSELQTSSIDPAAAPENTGKSHSTAACAIPGCPSAQKAAIAASGAEPQP